tara:strand:- start:151 stop:537 length:387 start_codon:yes stop_codon:yes gene_type:complete
MKINIPVSLGELIDKITILEIKSSKIRNSNKKLNIEKELYLLSEIFQKIDLKSDELKMLTKKLKKINEKLWNIEDNIRVFEKDKNFGEEFIKTAREVYFLNDKRFEVKNEINNEFNSEIIEEKYYEEY